MGDYFPVNLRRIKLTNFRKYKRLEVDLNAPVVMITGKNGSGKTSVLEAISMISSLRSFRRSSDKEMIEWDKDYYALELEYKGPNGIEILKLGYGKADAQSVSSRSLIVNGNKVKTLSDFLGRFQTVVFSPEDLKIIDGGPAERRKYVDMVLSLLSSGYLDALQKYRKALELRGALLKKGSSASYVSSIDRELSAYGCEIQSARRSFAGEFQKLFAEYIERISHGEDQWNITYAPSVAGGEDKDTYFTALKNAYEKDRRYKQTTLGIHRDRFLFHVPGSPERDMRMAASQGQKRTAALSLRMAQYRHTQEKTHETPVILIDDVLTELDSKRRNGFIRFMSEVGQALVALTDTESIQEYIQAKSSEKILIYKTAQVGDEAALVKSE